MKKLATNRKLGRTTDIRMAMLKTLTTDLIMHGKVETTLARAKEVKAMADSLISLAIKEKDNFEMVDVKVVKAKLDAKGNKETELVKSKNGKEYLKVVKEETTEKRQKDCLFTCKKEYRDAPACRQKQIQGHRRHNTGPDAVQNTKIRNKRKAT